MICTQVLPESNTMKFNYRRSSVLHRRCSSAKVDFTCLQTLAAFFPFVFPSNFGEYEITPQIKNDLL